MATLSREMTCVWARKPQRMHEAMQVDEQYMCEEGTGDAVMVMDVAAEEEIVMDEAAEEEASHLIPPCRTTTVSQRI